MLICWSFFSECVIPDVSRTYHFGSSGINMNPYFQVNWEDGQFEQKKQHMFSGIGHMKGILVTGFLASSTFESSVLWLRRCTTVSAIFYFAAALASSDWLRVPARAQKAFSCCSCGDVVSTACECFLVDQLPSHVWSHAWRSLIQRFLSSTAASPLICRCF